jgi:ribosomal protein S18 acetylase RimI-like enzyme
MSHVALGPQFRFIQASGSNPEAASGYHQIRHRESRKTAMSWNAQTGEIFSVATVPELQRQGHATAMWHGAHAIAAENPEVVAPRHSRIRSGAGDKWARAVGGELPERDLEKSYRGDE